MLPLTGARVLRELSSELQEIGVRVESRYLLWLAMRCDEADVGDPVFLASLASCLVHHAASSEMAGTAARLRLDELASMALAAARAGMTRAELTQAIPPAYTEYIGRALKAALG